MFPSTRDVNFEQTFKMLKKKICALGMFPAKGLEGKKNHTLEV